MAKDKQLFYVFSADNGDLSVERFFVYLYDKFPNVYNINFAIDLKNILKKLTHKFNLNRDNFLLKLEEATKDNWTKIDYNRSLYLIKIQDELLLLISSTKAEIYYSNEIPDDTVKAVIKIFKPKTTAKKAVKKFYLLKYEDGDYNLQPFDLKNNPIDLELFFNSDFLDFNNSVLEFLQDHNKSGIVLIYGKSGTGKTTYLKYLLNTAGNKFIIVPKKMFSALESPNFYFFISELQDYVIILEDCEQLLTGISKSTPIKDFLKNAEGLFASDFNYKIICTLTAQEQQINFNALSRAQNILKYQMRELEIEKANNLRKKFQLKGKITKPSVLADVLQPNPEILKNRKLGFNSK